MPKKTKGKAKVAAKEKAKAKKKPIKKRQYSENLQCDLTSKELHQAADDLARNLDDVEHIQTQQKDVMKQFKAKISRCEAEVDRIKSLVRNKYEYRQVRVEETRNFEKGTVTVKRLDNKKTVELRPMLHDEKQMDLL